jgi:folate-binding protein YgfZ
MRMKTATSPLAFASRPRAFVKVAGPDAEDHLQRMVSNDVAALAPGESCEALLLTPKARVIAPMRVLRRRDDDFLLLTEPELGETLRDELLRMRFAAKAEIELEEHSSYLLLGENGAGVANDDYGVPAVEVLDQDPPKGLPSLSDEDLERLRVEAGTPRFGKEIDDRVLPAEADLVDRAVSLTKGCFPGQEPIARLHYRGHANRGLRVLEVDGARVGSEIVRDGKVVGRVTSVAAWLMSAPRFPKTRCSTSKAQRRGTRGCARHDSNMRPLPPQGSALSPELRARGESVAASS